MGRFADITGPDRIHSAELRVSSTSSHFHHATPARAPIAATAAPAKRRRVHNSRVR